MVILNASERIYQAHSSHVTPNHDTPVASVNCSKTLFSVRHNWHSLEFIVIPVEWYYTVEAILSFIFGALHGTELSIEMLYAWQVHPPFNSPLYK